MLCPGIKRPLLYCPTKGGKRLDSNLAYRVEPREEIIGGEIFALAAPSLNHTLIAGNIFGVFLNHLRGKKCTPIPDGAALFLADGEEYQPDMMVVCDQEKLRADGVHGAPDLVVEVFSPSTGMNDRGHKMKVYEQCGVREYWIVLPRERVVEQYLLDDGRFVLNGMYHGYSKDEIERMKPEDRASAVTQFKCSLFDDLDISLNEVFARVTPAV